MTDPHPSDELASAYLDGATSPEEAAIVDADPALQARVDELGAVRAAFGELPAADPARRETAIAAALAAFAEEDAPARPMATVTPMPERRGLSPRMMRALSTAAVVAILALLVPLLATMDGDEEAKSFNSTGAAIGDASTDGGAEEAAESTTVKDAGALSGEDLGTYADFDELAAAVSSGAFTSPEAPEAQTSSGDDNAVSFCTAPEGATASGTAVVAGETVLVWLVTDADGTRRMTVRSPDGCQVLDEREL